MLRISLITGVRKTPFCLFIYDLVRINALDRLCPSRVPSSFCLRGDGEIRTHDPLLARQVLSQLSYTPIQSWQPPALPHRLQCSTIGRPGLNHRVRDENGCDPRAHRHQECVRLRFLTNICLASPRKRRRVIRDLPTSWAPPYDIP